MAALWQLDHSVQCISIRQHICTFVYVHYSFVHSFIPSVVCSFICSLTDRPTYSLTLTHLFMTLHKTGFVILLFNLYLL